MAPRGSALRPAILHVGNVAENAYVNAKLLQNAGYDNFVLSNDLYHFASWPEWDDLA
ncbi:MAG: hypothetical protein JO227_02300, partial [Acetobacteraceae bacterium]|nr:hypothetical protein [Acetobacteraceae bacterium]